MTKLPLILTGPIVRRVEPKRFTLWFMASSPLELHLTLRDNAGKVLYKEELKTDNDHILRFGQSAFAHHLSFTPPSLPKHIRYQLEFKTPVGYQSIASLLPDLCYDASEIKMGLRVPISQELTEIWHGSCRKPHYPAADALAAADQNLETRIKNQKEPPQALFMTGDQVYVDDLCGPMLLAVHQVIEKLGLHSETFNEQTAPFTDSTSLYNNTALYKRRQHLPSVLAENRWSRFLYRKTALITSQYCDNHLITFAEILALYLLCWSPTLWEIVDLPEAEELQNKLKPAQFLLYSRELEALKDFIKGLPNVRRLLAHLPTYMIFDDHDVTDDWNLSSSWEEAVYSHPFSRRIVGNALMAYWVCQGWGNNPEGFEDIWPHAIAYANDPTPHHHTEWIEHLLRFRRWDYSLATQPAVFVLDTRTRRWPAPHNPKNPSGLMNRAALQESLSQISEHESVILVSAAPVFGLKWIESIQAMASQIGYAQAVDAENWMAHGGTARTFLNFLSTGTRRITILSGDVHYSFCYDVVLRFRDKMSSQPAHGPRIWQVTASGLKNAFPEKLLKKLAFGNRWLYHPLSPLNLFTKRRNLWVQPRKIYNEQGEAVEALSCPSMGQVSFDETGRPTSIALFNQNHHSIFEEPS